MSSKEERILKNTIEMILLRYEKSFGAAAVAAVRLGKPLHLRLQGKSEGACGVHATEGDGRRLVVAVRSHVLDAATACGWTVELTGGYWTQWDRDAPCVVERKRSGQ